MEKNQMIILVVVLAVVVIVIVAAVLMMGGGGAPAAPTGPYPTGPGSTVPPPSETPSTGQPSTPVGNDVASAIAAGMPVLCTMTMDMGVMSGDPSLAGMTTTMSMKMESQKVRAEGSSMGMSFTVISDGVNAYVHMPMLGPDWYIASGEGMNVEVPTPEEVRQQLANLPEGMTLNCQPTGDIPDSEFQLPPGVVPKDMSEMMGGFDPSMYQ